MERINASSFAALSHFSSFSPTLNGGNFRSAGKEKVNFPLSITNFINDIKYLTILIRFMCRKRERRERRRIRIVTSFVRIHHHLFNLSLLSFNRNTSTHLFGWRWWRWKPLLIEFRSHWAPVLTFTGRFSFWDDIANLSYDLFGRDIAQPLFNCTCVRLKEFTDSLDIILTAEANWVACRSAIGLRHRLAATIRFQFLFNIRFWSVWNHLLLYIFFRVLYALRSWDCYRSFSLFLYAPQTVIDFPISSWFFTFVRQSLQKSRWMCFSIKALKLALWSKWNANYDSSLIPSALQRFFSSLCFFSSVELFAYSRCLHIEYATLTSLFLKWKFTLFFSICRTLFASLSVDDFAVCTS